jgi:hypothetical protein
MKHIRSALAAGLLVIGGAAVASAQQSNGVQATQQREHTQGAKAQRGRERGFGKQLYKGISLSADEKANIKNVHAKYAEQIKALRGKNLTPEQRTQAMQLRTAERNELRAALSPENRTKFDANAAKMKARMQKRMAQGKQEHRAAGQPPRA